MIKKIVSNFLNKSLNKWITIQNQDGLLVKYHRTSRIGTTKFKGMNRINQNVYLNGKINIGYASSLGEECWLNGEIRIGNYVQFGPRVCVHATGHTTNTITPYNSEILFNGALKKNIITKEIIIGHSVWIGYGAIILPGVRIGNGAVIGAGSVVTKDVDSYSIVCGTPAKPIRKRFNESIIKEIESTKWWNMSTEELDKYSRLFNIDIIEDSAVFVKEIRNLGKK